jgi:lipopolysaccharide transport system ATP-binding protein
MSSDVVIRARDLGKAYPIYARPSDRLKHMLTRGRLGRPVEFWAVRGVDLELRRGETVGIVGRNGAGKSTLLEMISGTVEPTCGSVEVAGRVAALLGLGAGFHADFTGRENIELNGAILGLSRAAIARAFDEIVAFADIGPFIDQPVKTYSSGMHARLAFAVAIHTVPDVLIVDEILSVGDEAFQRKCFARIEAIKARGATILFVSHSAQSVLELCDRAVLLEGGEQLLVGAPRAVVALYQKLVYAPAEQVETVRAAIRQEAREPGSVVSTEPPASEPAPEPAPVEPLEPVDPAFLDPNFRSQSTLHYEVNGAVLRDPVVTTRDGEPVNHISPGHAYVFRYDVAFEKDAFDVHYHTLLKTVTGLELGGGTWPPIGEIGADVAAGRVVHVEFEFECRLNPGVYFLNCGVTGSGGQQLHRIIDAVALRVLAMPAPTTFGHVHFGHRPRVSGEG